MSLTLCSMLRQQTCPAMHLALTNMLGQHTMQAALPCPSVTPSMLESAQQQGAPVHDLQMLKVCTDFRTSCICAGAPCMPGCRDALHSSPWAPWCRL